MEPSTAPQATSIALQYGVLGVAALVFALAIIHLFRTMRADQAASKAEAKAMDEERTRWATEREALRTEYERKHRELVESYAEAVRDDREAQAKALSDERLAHAKALSDERLANRQHEDQARREFADIMERVAAEGGKASQALVAMMDKFYDRFVGSGRR